MANYALEVYTASYNTTTLIGMAKDGHNIIGPYQERAEDAETGDLWNCVAFRYYSEDNISTESKTSPFEYGNF